MRNIHTRMRLATARPKSLRYPRWGFFFPAAGLGRLRSSSPARRRARFAKPSTTCPLLDEQLADNAVRKLVEYMERNKLAV
jgi:hypothetical protein